MASIDLEFLNQLGYQSILAFLLFSINLIGISLISTAFTIIYKSPGIINRLYLSATSILSGVAFPIELLPKFLEILGQLLPTTHFLTIVRIDIVTSSEQISVNYGNFLFLILSAIALLIIGILIINKAIEVAKKNGSLLLY